MLNSKDYKKNNDIIEVTRNIINAQFIYTLVGKFLSNKEIDQHIELIKSILKLVYKNDNEKIINKTLEEIKQSIEHVKKEGLQNSIDALKEGNDNG